MALQLKNEIQYSDLTNIKYFALARRCSNWVACIDSLTEIIFYYLQLRVTGEFTVLNDFRKATSCLPSHCVYEAFSIVDQSGALS